MKDAIRAHERIENETLPGVSFVLEHQNGLTILGFAGNTAPDHIDHLHGLPVFLRMLLENRPTESM